MKTRIMIAAGFYLAALSIGTGMQMVAEWSRAVELKRQAIADIYAPVTSVRWQVDDGRLLVVAGVSRKLEQCFVKEGAPVSLVATWRDAQGRHFKSHPARSADGADVRGAPIVTRGDEFVVGPFIVQDTPAIIAAIESIAIRLPCDFESGITRLATIGPIKPEN